MEESVQTFSETLFLIRILFLILDRWKRYSPCKGT